MPPKFFLSQSDIDGFNADVWAADKNQQVADAWQQQQMDALNRVGSWAAPQGPQPAPLAPGAPEPAPAPEAPQQAPTMPADAPVLDLSKPPPIAPTAPLPSPSRSTPSPATQPAAAPPPTGDFASMVVDAAKRHGIDPNVALRVAQSEGGLTQGALSGDSGSSFGPFQLHYGGVATGGNAVAGLGDEFTRQTGLDARDPKNAAASIDFALSQAAQGGWGPFHGAARAGIGQFEGIGGQSAPSTPDLSLSQFSDKTISADEAYAACGPAAAARLASIYGNSIPLSVAMQAAKQVGWTPGGGMNGIANEKKLMDALGLPAELDTSGDWNRIVSAAGNGQMVTISTPGHYFSASGTRPRADGQTELYVGQSGLDLKGGKAWMTPAEIEQSMGKINGALFSDPSKAVAAGEWMQRAAADHGIQPESPDQTLSQLEQARQKAGLSRPDETVTNPFGEAFRQVGDVVGQVGGAIGNALNPQQPASPGMAAPGQGYDPSNIVPRQGPPGVPLRQDVRDLNQQPQPTIFDQAGQAIGGALTDVGRTMAGQDVQTRGLEVAGQAGTAAAGDVAAGKYSMLHEIDTIREINAKYPQLKGVPDSNVMTPEDFDRYVNAFMAVGGTTSPVNMEGGAARFFHGTGSDFPRPDPANFDPNGLFGPGYYVTSDARVAGSYASTRAQGAGSNIRAVDVPSGANLLDAEAPPSPAVKQVLQDAFDRLYPNHQPGIGPATIAHNSTLADLYRYTEQGGYLSRESMNQALADAGFDGIQYAGGKRIPMNDSAGAPIEHTAVVVFPSSLDKLRNAISGRQGGAAAAPLATTLGGAVAGGAGTYLATDPNDPNRGLKVAGGALAGGLAGSAAGRLLGGTPAARGAMPLQSTNPLIQRTGQMLQAGPPTPPVDSLRTQLVRAWTNRNVSLDQFQEETARLSGLNPRAVPPNADAQALIRLSSDPAAEIRIQNEFKPAIQAVGDDASWLSTYLMHANNVDVAKQLGNVNRKFPGGFTAADSQAVLNDLPTELGSQRYANVQQAAQQVGSFVKGIRQRMVDSGLIDQSVATQWETQYPNWVPTRILDYMDEAGQGLKIPKKLSLGDAGVKKYTLEGTNKFAEDPLGALVGLARSVETRALKNEVVNALVNLDQMRPAGRQLLQATQRPPTAGENVVQRIVQGQVERYIAPPELAAVINGPVIGQAPGYVRAFTNFQRAVTTVLSPAFALVRNPSMDIPEYVTRELSRSGGNPLALPSIMADMVRGYASAFKGLAQGEFRGDTARFMSMGGGDSGLVAFTVADRKAAVEAMARSNVLEIKNMGDVQRLLSDLVHLRPIAAIAQRTELGPRTASMIRAERTGVTPARAALAGRTVTMDFAEGGTLAKTINSFVPFFNVGFQGSAQMARMARENPVGAASSLAMTVGLPAAAATAWNRADAQRSKDYDDVPQYLKDQGIVLMLPGETSTDAKGNRKPPMLWLNMRGFAPVSTLARDATERSLQFSGNGNAQPEHAQDLLGSIFWSMSPIRASTLGDVPGAVGAENFPVPGGGTALQLALNKDIFRRSDIVSKRNDESAPQLAKEIAAALTEIAQIQDPNKEIHPSQVNFAVRELLGGVGSTIMGAREMLPGGERVDTTAQGAPVVGGALKSLGIRSDTGETLSKALDQPVSPEVERVLRDAGVATPTIPNEISIRSQMTGSTSPPMTLHQDERAEYQRLMSERLSQRLAPIVSQPNWAQRPIQSRNAILDAQVKAAREYAEVQIYSKMAPADRQARMQAGRELLKPKPKP